MEPIESLTTPTTCVGSDDGKLPQTHQRKWNAFRNGRPPVHHQSQQQQEQLLAGKGFTSVRILPTSPHHPTKKRPAAAQGRSLLKRAIHKIGKRRKRVPTPPAPIVDTDPPKVEDLGIDPRLLQKWVERKELKKQQQLIVAGGTGQKKIIPTRRAATVVLLGLSAGSVAWLKERALRWRKTNGIVLAACIVAVAVGVACTLVIRRCA